MTIPAGIITIWSGAIVDIPPGWILCDGNGGSPNLTDRFVIGAGDSFAPDDTGGAATHTHTFTGDAHFHELQVGTGIQAGADWDNETQTEVVTGTTDPGSSMPTFYALAYIMKT